MSNIAYTSESGSNRVNHTQVKKDKGDLNYYRKEYPVVVESLEKITKVTKSQKKELEILRKYVVQLERELSGSETNYGDIPVDIARVPYGLWWKVKQENWKLKNMNKFILNQYGNNHDL